MVPIGIPIHEERLEASADDFVIGGEAAEIDEGGVDVDEADDGVCFSSVLLTLHTWRETDDERRKGGAFPEGVFLEGVFFAEVVTVVGPENDDGVVAVRARFKGVEDLADLGVHEGDAGEVALDDVLPLVFFFGPFGAGVAVVDGVLGRFGDVFEVVFFVGRQGQFFAVIHVEVFLRGVPRDVGAEEADHEHEGFGVLFTEALDGPVRGEAVAHFALFAIVRSPVGEGVVALPIGFDLLAVFVAVVVPLSPASGQVEVLFRKMFVEDFSDGHRLVAVFFEVAVEEFGTHGLGFFFDVVVFGLELFGFELVVKKPAHDARAGGAAEGILAVGPREPSALTGEAIHVGRDDLGVAAITSPVVEVIDGDEEDVGFLG